MTTSYKHVIKDVKMVPVLAGRRLNKVYQIDRTILFIVVVNFRPPHWAVLILNNNLMKGIIP